MLLSINAFNVEVIWKPGKHMYLADHLSRACLTENISEFKQAKEQIVTAIQDIEETDMSYYLPMTKDRINKMQ